MGYVTDAEPRRRDAPRLSVHEVVLAGIALALLVAKVRLLSTININWDEFAYLSRVHEFSRGALASTFQTFHVHLFSWLSGVPGTEIDQMLAARRVAFALTIASAALVFALATRLASRSGAWVAVIAMLTHAFHLRHAESFRADPFIGFLVLAAVATPILAPGRRGAIVAAAVAYALALAISIKTSLFLPAVIAVLVLGWRSAPEGGARRLRLRGATLFAGVTVIAYAALLVFHAVRTSAQQSDFARRAFASGAGMLGGANFSVLERTLGWDWPFWALLAVGAAAAAHQAVRGADPWRERARLVLALLLPLASLLLYRNSYPYFYVTLVPMASVAGAFAVARLEAATSRWALWHPLLVLAVAAPLVLRGRESLARLTGDGVAPQRALLRAVHEIFPQPVPYLDRCGMVASFPRANMFMSTYVLEGYRARGTPVMADLVADRQPRFVLANVSGLYLERPWDVVREYEHRLLREDFEYLRDHFIPHWGPIWVAGRTVAVAATDSVVTIAVAGPYTVESPVPVLVDDVQRAPGDVVTLQRGPHRLRLAGGVTSTAAVTLRYGDRLPRPPNAPTQWRLFRAL